MTTEKEKEWLEPGEWLDKEPRADGKPRRWRPFVVLTIPQDKIFSLASSERPFDDSQPCENTTGK